MLTFNLDPQSHIPLYSQLYSAVRSSIEKGEIAAGERLPSKRELASHLKISVVTVESAYSQLCAEGYIHSKPGSGFYAEKIQSRLASENMDIPHIDKDPPEDNYKYDFGTNRADTAFFPFSSWAKLSREVLNSQSEDLLNSCGPYGTAELRVQIAAYLKSFRGMNVNPKQIVVGAGSEYLTGLIIQLLGRERSYGIENPGYGKIYRIFKQNCMKTVPIAMDGYGADIRNVFDNTDIFHITPSHHFPLGTIMPVSRRQEILGMVYSENGKYIIEDDYDSELRLGGKPIPTLQSIDISEKVIYMNTFTKTLASTVRISYMILPRPLLEQFYQKLSFYSCTVSNFEQYTLDLFIKEGYFEKHINRLRNYYQNKKNGFLSAIWDSGLYKCVEISGEEAGVHFLMKLKTEKAEENVIELAKAQGIKLSPLSKFYYEKKAGIENTYVMNYSSVDMERIGKIVRGLEKIC